MKITFDHIALRAKKPSLMKDFLISLLGFNIGFRPNFPFEGYWLYSDKKDVIHIFNEEASFYKTDLMNESIKEETSVKSIINHICFFSDNYEEVMQRIHTMNLDYSSSDAPDLDIKQIFIKAPENLLIEIQAKIKTT